MTAQPQKLQTQAEAALAQQLESLLQSGDLSSPREDAAKRLNNSGLPHRRIEEWKYTDLRAMLKVMPALADAGSDDGHTAPMVKADVYLSVVNGMPTAIDGSIPDCISVSMRSDEQELAFHDKPNANVDLNLSLANSGFSISVSKTEKAPVIFVEHLVTVNQPVSAASRHHVALEPGAEAIVVERYSGPDDVAYFVSSGFSAFVAEGAELTHARVVSEGNHSSHLGAIGARIAANATYEPFVLTLGSQLVRTDMQLTFDGEYAHGGVRGATLVKGREHTDMTLEVDHASPNCTSIEQFKSVIADDATAVFQGKIMVKQIAQKTDAKMMSQGLLLSENGAFLNKPELEIFADDVVCGHGATCGDIDENMLFYLLSRGIPRSIAETMMVQAFVAEAIEDTEEPIVIDALELMLAEWLENR